MTAREPERQASPEEGKATTALGIFMRPFGDLSNRDSLIGLQKEVIFGHQTLLLLMALTYGSRKFTGNLLTDSTRGIRLFSFESQRSSYLKLLHDFFCLFFDILCLHMLTACPFF